MTDAIADSFFEHNSVLEFPLAAGTLQDDLVNAVAYAQNVLNAVNQACVTYTRFRFILEAFS